MDELARQGPLVAFALLVLSLLLRGILRFDREVRRLEEDRDYWKAAAERSLGITEKLINGTPPVGRRRR